MNASQAPRESLSHDLTCDVVRANLARIKLMTAAGRLLTNPHSVQRVIGLLQNRRDWGLPPPLLMLTVVAPGEEVAAAKFAAGDASHLASIEILKQEKHTETMGNAIQLFRAKINPEANVLNVKRQTLLLSRRGGQGKSLFVSPFTEGQGTTCGIWTRPVKRNRDGSWAENPDGTVIKGFMKAAVAVGFCPVECTYCYLQIPYTDGMDIALNLEDLRDELKRDWQGYPYPINFGETSGLVEYDEWFAGQDGRRSIVQFVIDACAEASVTPFFLTKIRYPRYLQFRNVAQVGISLMPEPVRVWLAPHGSPSDELLKSLAWAVSAGGRDPVVRMTVLWEQRHLYPDLLRQCCALLGHTGWRLTLDILRFSPATALTIGQRHPEAAEHFAKELAPAGDRTLQELALEARKTHEKKVRPPAERQDEIFTWFRQELNLLGCPSVLLTSCKGDPDELLPLVRNKTISAMPCACYGVSLAHEQQSRRLSLPVISE